MALWLRAHTALPKDPGFSPIPRGGSQPCVTPSSKGFNAFFWSLRTLNTCSTQTYKEEKYMYTLKIKVSKDQVFKKYYCQIHIE